MTRTEARAMVDGLFVATGRGRCICGGRRGYYESDESFGGREAYCVCAAGDTLRVLDGTVGGYGD